MRINQLNPQPTECVSFERTMFWKVPQVAGCYILATSSGDILYIGQTKDLYKRIRDHLNDPQKTDPTPEGTASHFCYFECPEEKLQELESSWVDLFKAIHGKLPILNTINPPYNQHW